MRKFPFVKTLALIFGLSPLPAAADGLEIGLQRLAALDGGCRADLGLHNGWRRDFVRFSIDLYILDRNGKALERQIVDIAPLPAGRTIKAPLPLASACAEIGGLHIVATPSCRLAGEKQNRDCLADLSVREDTAVPLTVQVKR
jgi:hypothetical protein